MTQTMTREIAPRFHSQKIAKVTFEQFLELAGGDRHIELVGGYIVEMPSVTEPHSKLGSFLIKISDEFVIQKDSCSIFYDPFIMYTAMKKPGEIKQYGRAPDLMFVAKKNLHRVQSNHIVGPADLVIEIISPGSQRIDREEKFAEYQTGGVPEYWHFDPKTKEAKFFLRDANGKYQPVEPDADGIIRSTTIEGFFIKTEWLWRNPKPSVIEVLKAWGLL